MSTETQSHAIDTIGGRSVESIRLDFPIISDDAANPRAYLDSAATSHKPQSVIDAVASYYREANANVHRALHSLAAESTLRYEHARNRVAELIGAPSPRSIVFTRGTTESINLVVSSWGGEFLSAGDVVLLTEMEHHANLVPWQLLAQRTGIELRFIPFDDAGKLDLDTMERVWDDRVKLVSVIHVSNVLGTVNDVEAITRFAHDRGAPVLVDAAQSVPHRAVDVSAIDCDFLAFSGHKMYGPTGIGALYAKPEHLEKMPPYMGGGEMIQAVWLDRAEWNEVPYKFEAGTPNIAGAVGLGAAVDYLELLGLDAIQRHEEAICDYAFQQLAAVPGVTIHGPQHPREALVSFSIEGMHPHDIAQFLDRERVAVRAGHHCAHPLTRKLGVPATVRASFGVYTTVAEIDRLIEAIGKAKEFFGDGV